MQRVGAEGDMSAARGGLWPSGARGPLLMALEAVLPGEGKRGYAGGWEGLGREAQESADAPTWEGAGVRGGSQTGRNQGERPREALERTEEKALFTV